MAKSDNTFSAKKQYILRLLQNGTLERLIQGADSDKELYESLKIGKTMWFRLKKEVPELKELVIRTRYETFIEIKGAMKKRALGYSYEETEQEMVVDPRTGMQHKGKIRKYTRHVPPDLSAQKLLIANLKSQECRDHRESELSNWTNSTATVEIKTEGQVSLAVDDAIREVLKEIENDK